MFALYNTPLYKKNRKVYTQKGLSGYMEKATPIDYNEINTKTIRCAFSELFTNTMMNEATSLFTDLLTYYEDIQFINGDIENEDGIINEDEIMSTYIIDKETADDLCNHTDLIVAYCDKYNLYFLCVGFCGCSWDYVTAEYRI